MTDVPLVESGRRDAELLRARLERHRFALVLASPRVRARDTAELAGLGGDVEVDEDLVEVDYGDYEGLTTPEIRERGRAGTCGTTARPAARRPTRSACAPTA